MKRYPDWMKFCNCAQCGRRIVGESSLPFLADDQRGPLEVAGRIHGRPFCRDCLIPQRPRRGKSGVVEDAGPWQENAIREREG